MEKEETMKNSRMEIEEKKRLYRTHPYMSPKFIIKLVGLGLLGVIGWLPIEGGTTTLSQSALGNLVFLIFLITAFYKIAMKNPSGWLFLAGFFYYGAFAHQGVVAWLYMIITGLALYVHSRWCKDV